MANQITETRFFTSSFVGSPIVVESSDPTAPTQIHSAPAPALTLVAYLKQQAVYLTARNTVNDRTLVWIYFNPVESTGSITNSAVIPVNLGPYESRPVFIGERIGKSFADGFLGVVEFGSITAFADVVAGEDLVKITGHIVEYDQTGT